MSKDFTSFTFNGVTSDELGIVRVSNGDRYDENLYPEINDRTSEVAGKDGQYYFGTDYGAKPISVSFAYDNLTEEQFRKIRQVFNPKTQGKLIFAESPYKAYIAKVESPIEMNYICFDEHKRHLGETIEGGGIRYVDKDGQRVREDITPWVYEYDEHGAPVMERIYKGEGTIEFICYYPFAKSVFKVLPTARPEDEGYEYNNVDEWAAASRILTSAEYEAFDTYNNGIIYLYNAGDINTGLRIYYPLPNNSEELNLSIFYKYGINTLGTIKLTNFVKQGEDEGIIINTDNQLIQGINNFQIGEDGNVKYTTTGTLYNKYCTGSFFKIQPSIERTLQEAPPYLQIEGGNENMKIFYDYLYL